MRKSFAVIVVLLFAVPLAFAASVEKASLLRRHGLLPQAKVELIDVIFSTAADPVKARAYYDLGSIAFEENDVTAALETWTQLVESFPNSEQAGLVKGRIKELAEIVGKVSRSTVENAVAESYLRHADFWSKHKADAFEIDSSWIPHVEAACKWYDKVITEFPKTNASWLAYEGKLRTLLGWKERGEYGEAYGVEKNFATYMPQVLSTFAAFETDHPDASSLQASGIRSRKFTGATRIGPRPENGSISLSRSQGTRTASTRTLRKGDQTRSSTESAPRRTRSPARHGVTGRSRAAEGKPCRTKALNDEYSCSAGG